MKASLMLPVLLRSLEGYQACMADCAARFVEQLKVDAVNGTPIDIWRRLGAMTLAVVGTVR